MTDREAYISVLYCGPLQRGDAVVVLSGDGEQRMSTALELLMQGAAHNVVISGGVDAPPFSLSAQRLGGVLIERGLAPDRLRIEDESRNTREQAERVVEMAVREGWNRILLVTSHYHMPRAYLTFVQVLKEAGKEEVIHVCPVPAAHLAWWLAPEGVEDIRVTLLGEEFEKIREYQDRGHVAGYDDGLAYLKYWEGR